MVKPFFARSSERTERVVLDPERERLLFALVELLEVDLGGDLVDDRGRAERPRQGERSADPDRRPRRRAGRRPGEQGEAQRAAGAQNGQASKKTFHRAASVSGMTSRAKRRMLACTIASGSPPQLGMMVVQVIPTSRRQRSRT